jgi:hypothetical protein
MIILIKSTLKLDVKWESSNFGIRLLLSFRLSLSQKSIDILSKALCPSNSKKNKGLPRTKHDMTAVCQQRIFFLHLFCFIISRVKYAFQIKYPILFYGSSITRYDDYLAKNCIKIGWKIRKFIFWNLAFDGPFQLSVSPK